MKFQHLLIFGMTTIALLGQVALGAFFVALVLTGAYAAFQKVSARNR